MSSISILLLQSEIYHGYSNKMGILEDVQRVPFRYTDNHEETVRFIKKMIHDYKNEHSISHTVLSFHSYSVMQEMIPLLQSLQAEVECEIQWEAKIQSYSHYVLHECHDISDKNLYFLDLEDQLYGCFLLDGKEFPKNGPTELGSSCGEKLQTLNSWLQLLADKKGLFVDQVTISKVKQWITENDPTTTNLVEDILSVSHLLFTKIKTLTSIDSFIVISEWSWLEDIKETDLYLSNLQDISVNWLKPLASTYLTGAKYSIKNTRVSKNSYSLSTIIETSLNNLTEREKQAAQYIAAFPEKISNMTISQLSKETKVSEATITRLSQKLQFKNFNQLKLVASESGTQSIDSVPKATKSYEWLQNEYFQIIQKADDLIEKKKMVKIAKTISSSRRIMIYARGLSGHIAQKIKFKLLEYGFIADFIGDSAFMTLTSNQLTAKDSVIVVSVSGENQEIIPPVKNAKKRGASVFVFTNQKNSTLATLANETVLIASNRFLDKDSLFGEQVPMIYSVEVMFYEIKQLIDKETSF